MSEKKYVVILFESAEKAAGFYNNVRDILKAWDAGSGMRLLDSDEYPTKRYNGWTNYETWLVNLWIGNERGSYEYWREESQSVWNEATPGEYDWQTREQQATYALSKHLEEELDENMPEEIREALGGFYSDLLNAALSEVNWEEIAEHMIADVDKTQDEEEKVSP